MLHRIVAAVFIPNPENKRTVNHINGVKTDNRVENLEWATHSENSLHAVRVGLTKYKKGEGHHLNRMTKELAALILSETGTHQEIADKLGVGRHTVSGIKSGRAWSDVTGVKHVKEKRLSEEDVLDIFNSASSLREIAEKYNIREGLASSIRNGWVWCGVTGKKRVKGDRYLLCNKTN